jgi:hypothetical protein
MENISFNLYPLKDFQPPDGANVVVRLRDLISGGEKYIGAYFKNGIFWDSNNLHALHIEDSCSSSYNKKTARYDVLKYDWKVEAWARLS